MLRDWLSGLRKYLVGTSVAVAITGSVAHAGDDSAELRKLIEEQSRQIEALKQRLDAQPAGSAESSEAGAPAAPGKYVIDAASVNKIVADYLKENPGAGMPASVQTGYFPGQGFRVSSAPNPNYKAWDDESKVPFDLRIRGRIQSDYYFYKVNDKENHLTHAIGANNDAGDFSQFMIKRMRLNFAGTAFTPQLRYMIEIDGGTRGIAGLANGNGLATPVAGVTTFQGGNGLATVDHSLRLFQAWVAYDFRPCCFWKGCGDDCCDDTPKYAPTFSLIAGKFKPYFTFEEWMGSGNEQFVEYGIATWYFDSDDDNLATGAGFQIKAMEDRFFSQFMINNGEETQIANAQMDRLPGIVWGAHYDFGGTWDADKHQWQLYGDCISDIDYSCNLVGRVGGAVYASPNDRRSIYSNAELNRIRTMPGAPGGSNVVGIFNGGTPATAGTLNLPNSLDSVDDYRLEAFWALKYRGFSLMNDWFVRDLDNFRGQHLAGANGHLDNTIIYTVADPLRGTRNAILPANHGIVDFGTQLQGGYFIIPKKLEIAARWSWINGQSGNLRGTNQFVTATPASVGVGAATFAPGTLGRYVGAFSKFSAANEYTVGVNYYWKRQNLKWQTDVGYYDNNPAAGGQSASGYITGANGYLLRTQLQLWF